MVVQEEAATIIFYGETRDLNAISHAFNIILIWYICLTATAFVYNLYKVLIYAIRTKAKVFKMTLIYRADKK